MYTAVSGQPSTSYRSLASVSYYWLVQSGNRALAES